MQQGLASKFGNFLILVGLGILLVFIAMDLGGMLRFDYFFLSIVLIFIGFKMRVNKNPTPSSRFKTFKSIHGRIKEKKDSKNSKTYIPDEDLTDDYDQTDFTS